MNKIIIVVLLLLLIIPGVMFAKGKTDKQKVVFDVSMTCKKCQNKIKKNIAFEKGVTDMKVNLAEKTVEIEYKTKETNVENLKKALENLGYQVSLHKNSNLTKDKNK